MEDNFSMDEGQGGGGAWGVGGMVQAVMRSMVRAVMRAMGSDGERAADEALLTHPLLTSCRAAQFLTGCGPVPVRGLGVGDP